MRLCINIDHIATLREARGGVEPDPVTRRCISGRARRRARYRLPPPGRPAPYNDRELRPPPRIHKDPKLDLEMAATDEIVKIAIETLPELVTFVPERRQELTTEGGLMYAVTVTTFAMSSRRCTATRSKSACSSIRCWNRLTPRQRWKPTRSKFIRGEYANARRSGSRLELLEVVRAAGIARTAHAGWV